MKRIAGLATIAVLVTACGTTPEPAPPTGTGSPLTGSGSPAATTAPSPDLPAHASHQLVIDVSGTATIETLTYVIDEKSTDEHEVGLPWRKTFTFPYGTGRHTWRVVLTYPHGDTSATATVDGQPMENSSGSGGGTLNLAGDFND